MEVGEEQESRHLYRQIGHGLQHGFGDEGQSTFGAHQQVAEDVHRSVEIDEGVEGVASGVLRQVFRPDARSQGRIRQKVRLQP